jgi:CarboxypepD_reg-like domain
VADFITARHRVAIAGLVLDQITGKPLAGAQLEITAKPAAYAKKLELLRIGRAALVDRSGTTRTRQDGLFFFLDLPEGKYELVGFMSTKRSNLEQPAKANGEPDSLQWMWDKRYGKATFKASVSYGQESFDKLTVLHLGPTGITGRVLTSANNAALMMAEVRVKGSGERTLTDSKGEFTLSGIQPNERQERVLQIRARGYRDQSLPVMVDKPGSCKRLEDIKLVREGE